MSFFLDPPALFIIGVVLFVLRKRYGWKIQNVTIIGGFIAFILFMGGSALLYLDMVRWPLPDQKGSVWMFHTDITGISKAAVPIVVAVVMLLIYPLWLYLGHQLAQRWLTKPMVLTSEMFSYEDVKSRREKSPTEFVVLRGRDRRKLTRDALTALGGIERFVSSGDRVVIKANICGGNPEIPGSYTSIDVVEEVVESIWGIGAEPYVVDSDMIWTEFDPVAKLQGWKDWTKRAKTPLVNLAKTECAHFDFGDGSSIGKAIVSKDMIEADVIISIPTMKTHILTNVTLGMKNMYGTFPEIDKAKFHEFGIEDVIYEVNKAFTPNLTIIDGSIGGDAMGPLSCEPVYFQTIVASNDVVAADSIACQLMGYDPLDVEHIKKANDQGLGDASVNFDVQNLPYVHEKDGGWTRPDPEVTKFYGNLIEEALSLPGMKNFFDLGADFLLYGTATLPIFDDLTPQTEKVLNDSLGMAIRSGLIISGRIGKLRSRFIKLKKKIGLL